MSKYLCAVTLIIGVTGCQSSTNAAGGGASSSPPGASSPSGSRPSVSPTVPLLPPAGVLTRVAELSSAGGIAGADAMAVPTVAVYSDGTVVLSGQKRLTLTPGALDVLVSTLQQDLKDQPAKTVLQPKGGHPYPDETTTVLGVYQPGGTYQTVSALGLSTGTASQYPAPVADAFAKVQALTSDAATPYTTTKVRYSLRCAPQQVGVQRPWPTGLPQPTAGQPIICLEVHNADGAVATVVRAACTDTNTREPQPAAIAYRSDNGLRICAWRYALPDETASS